MAARSVLIAALSARALAEAARRAGFAPLVVDAFGDEDTRAAAAAMRTLPEAFRDGFIAGPLVAALEAVTAEAGTPPPVGLVLGTGFEDTPRLVDHLAKRFRLLGADGDTIRRAKDPRHFFPLLERLGIRHPETVVSPPADGRGWLSKRIGGSGGGHIARCRARTLANAARYFQRETAGEAVSVGGVVARSGAILAFTRQWANPGPRRPYRFGGAVGPVELDSDSEARLIETALAVARELGLTGFASFDFLLTAEDALLVEVNPRAGATLDVLDDAAGTLFAAHMAACGAEGAGRDVVELARSWRPDGVKALAYFYAGADGITVPAIEWRRWTADRPAAGTRIGPHGPVASVRGAGADEATARWVANERLGVLADLLYPRTQETPGKENAT